MRARTASSRGQIIVIMALALPGLLGAMALCIDVWNLYSNWTHLQIAADAGVLAGATYLRPNDASTEATADPVARTYAQHNGVQNGEITSVTFAPDQTWIRMTVTRPVPFYFGRVLGLTTTPVSVAARASIQGATGTGPGGLAPIGIQCPAPCTSPPYSPGTPISLIQKNPKAIGEVWAPGNWGALNLNIPLGSHGGGVPLFASNIVNGYQGTVIIGNEVPTDTGFGKSSVNPQVRDAINTLINEGIGLFPDDTPSIFDPTNPRIITVPLVDFTGVTGTSNPVIVEGFASIWLTSASADGTIEGVFITTTANAVLPGGGGTPCVTACAPVLTE